MEAQGAPAQPGELWKASWRKLDDHGNEGAGSSSGRRKCTFGDREAKAKEPPESCGVALDRDLSLTGCAKR